MSALSNRNEKRTELIRLYLFLYSFGRSLSLFIRKWNEIIASFLLSSRFFLLNWSCSSTVSTVCSVLCLMIFHCARLVNTFFFIRRVLFFLLVEGLDKNCPHFSNWKPDNLYCIQFGSSNEMDCEKTTTDGFFPSHIASAWHLSFKNCLLIWRNSSIFNKM